MSSFGSVESVEQSSAATLLPSSDMDVVQAPVKESWEHFNNRQRWALVFILFLIASSGAIDRAVMAILLEPIKQELHVSDTALGLLTGVAFGILYAILGMPIARYADRGDRRLLITVSVALWSIFTVGCGFARSFLQLFLMRIGVGVGEAGGTGAPLMSLLSDYFPPHHRARAVGVIQMSTVIGAVLGLIVGSVITQYYGWRTTFIAAGLPGVLLALIAGFALREPRARTAFAVSNTGGETLGQAFRVLIKKPTFMNATLAFLCFNFVANGALSFSAAYVVRVLHKPVAESGLASGILSIVSVLAGNAMGGVLADRLSKRDMAWLCRIPGYGMIITFPFYAAAFLVHGLISYITLSTIAAVVMLGSLPPIITTLLVVVGKPRRATGFTIAQMSASILGVTAGPIVTGMLSDGLAHFIGPVEGLRWAMVLSLMAFLPTGWFMLRASRTINADLEL